MSHAKTNLTTERSQQFRRWVEEYLPPSSHLELRPLSGDAGFRSYYRVDGYQPACLAVDAPPQTEKNHAFCWVTSLLRRHGIHSPEVLHQDLERGFLIVEDLGDTMYWPLLQESQRTRNNRHLDLYRDAEQCLLVMARIPVEDARLSLYDEHKLQQEMDLFPDWYVEKLLGITMNAAERAMLHNTNRLLVNNALEQPQVVVHRDFHCRNLMVVPDNNPGVIDFQDAVIGPVTYDLVSLYRDCYIQWPVADVKSWVGNYYQKCKSRGLLIEVDEATFQRWFDWMGLQRHIKVLGIFARLWLRDGKAGYLKDLPLVMHYTISVASQYQEFQPFVTWFEKKLLPVASQQEWYRVYTS